MRQFSDEQVYKARHALGLSRSKTAHRNYYHCSEDDEAWDNLVERGFAIKRSLFGKIVYQLAKQAAFFFLNSGENLDPRLMFPDVGSYPGCEILGYVAAADIVTVETEVGSVG